MSGIRKEYAAKILKVLSRARGPAPLGYISKQSGIEHPLELLRQLEKCDLVCRTAQGDFNLSLMPLFELTDKVKKLLQDHETSELINMLS